MKNIIFYLETSQLNDKTEKFLFENSGTNRNQSRTVIIRQFNKSRQLQVNIPDENIEANIFNKILANQIQ